MNFTVSVATFVMACYLWHWQVKVWCLVGTAFQVTGRFCFTAGFNSGSPPEKGLDILILLPVYILYSTLQVCHELHINVHSIPPVYIIYYTTFFLYFSFLLDSSNTFFLWPVCWIQVLLFFRQYCILLMMLSFLHFSLLCFCIDQNSYLWFCNLFSVCLPCFCCNTGKSNCINILTKCILGSQFSVSLCTLLGRFGEASQDSNW